MDVKILSLFFNISNMTKFEGIVFDMDGTIINSEQLHIDAWIFMFDKYNLPLNEQDVHQWIGVSDVIICQRLAKQFETKVPAEELLHEKRTYFREVAHQHVDTMPGTIEGLKNLELVPKAVATMSNKYEAEKSLKKTNIYKEFISVVTADDVEKHKPDPACYLKACEELGLPPSLCIGVEDSISGVASSKAAGLFTIGVANTIDKKDLKHADLVLNDTVEVMDYLVQVFNCQPK